MLDASALLAFLFREPGHEAVTTVIGDCCISTVNRCRLCRFGP